MSIAVWITLAPRDKETITRSLESLQKYLVWELHIYAEPGSPKIKQKNVKMHYNKEVLGNMWNFHNCLTSLIAQWKEYVMTLQDDYNWNKNIAFALQSFVESDNDGVAVLTTRPWMEKFLYKRWWNNVDLGWKSFWAAYLMKTETAKKIINSKLYQSHLKYYYANKTDDACVGETCLQESIPMWYYNPWPCTHFWESCLWHKDFALDQQVSKTAKKICVGIATIKERQNSFVNTMKSLALQADEIFVWLNYDRKEANNEVKEVLARENVTVLQWDWFARSKFFWLEHAEWYYLTCDDDILYPADYTKTIVEELVKRNNEVVVWYHWVVLKDDGTNWLERRDTYSFTFWLGKPLDVHYVGTWCMWFYTGLIDHIPHFWYDNFEDLGFAEFIQKKWIPAVCLPRKTGWLKEQKSTVSIYSKAKEKKKLLNNIAMDCNLRIIPSKRRKYKIRELTGSQIAEINSYLSKYISNDDSIWHFDAKIPLHKYPITSGLYHWMTDDISELGKLLKVYETDMKQFSFHEANRFGIVDPVYKHYVFTLWNNAHYTDLEEMLPWIINNTEDTVIHIFVPAAMHSFAAEDVFKKLGLEFNRVNGWETTAYTFINKPAECDSSS